MFPVSFALTMLAATGLAGEMSFTVLPEETLFQDTEFNAEAFEEIPGWAGSAEAHGLPSWQLFSKGWVFADGLLTTEGQGTEGFLVSFLPSHPLQEEAALVIAGILARGEFPELSGRDELAVVYEDDSGFGAGSRVMLMLNDGMVTEIRHLEWSP